MTSYIGREPAIGNFVKLDAISVVNGQAAYTMQSGSVNFVPESANHMLVSLNGVIQSPGSSFTVSGSTITFSSNLVTGDVINFIMVYGNVLDIGTPSDDTISTTKLQNTSVTAAKLATDAVETAKIQNDAVTTDKINLISTSSTPSLEAKGTAGQTDGYIQLNCEQNSHGIKLKSPPHSAGQSYTLTFPSTAPATDKFLQTNSSGVLSFADAGGGGMTFISSSTPSSSVATIGFEGVFSSTYRSYKIIVSGIGIATNNSDMIYKFYTGTNTEHTSGYYWSLGTSNRNGSSINENSDNDSSARFASNTSNDSDTISGEIIVFNPYVSSTKTTTITQFLHRYSSSATAFPESGGVWVNAGDQFTGITFQTTSGSNFRNQGKITIYGLHDS